jgi:hypothetical protein
LDTEDVIEAEAAVLQDDWQLTSQMNQLEFDTYAENLI